VRGSSAGASMSAVEAVSLAALAGTSVGPNAPATDVVADLWCRPGTGGGGECGAEDAGVDAFGLLGR
jgi:hypothetical protein